MKHGKPKRPHAAREQRPEPETEAPSAVDPELIGDVEAALGERHGAGLTTDETLRLLARTGDGSGWLKVRIGSDDRAYEAELFARDVEGELLDGALGVLVDYLDGLLEEWVSSDRDAWLPLDWDARAFEDVTLFVRGDLRDYAAERAADLLLNGNGHGAPERE